MAAHAVVDAGFLVALLSRRDRHHAWSVLQASRFPRPWSTCESALSEAFHLLGPRGSPALAALLTRGAIRVVFSLGDELPDTLRMMKKYDSVPMSLADACLVRMTEILSQSVILTTDTDFRIYRRHSRQIVPIVTPA